jgi:hypothetical protein
MIRALGLLLALLPAIASAAVSVRAPATVGVGQAVQFTVSGSSNPKDFASIVPKGAPAGSYDDYIYVSGAGPFTLNAPVTPGEYELRVLGAEAPYPTLARAPLRVQAVAVSLQAPDRVDAGARFAVRWTGPANAGDYVAIGDATQPYIAYAYVRDGNPLQITAPDVAGSYELRYFLAQGDTVIARRPIAVGGVSASLVGPAQVAAGKNFAVEWRGPNNAGDFVTLVAAGAPEGSYGAWAYTSIGPKLMLRAPDEPGSYELRYSTGQSSATLARAPLKITAVSGSVSGPAQATAGTPVEIRWTGPANAGDFVSIVRKGAPATDAGEYGYVASGNPLRIIAPLVPGDYEIRYSLAQSYATLARAPLKIVPGAQPPGLIAVTALATQPADRAVHVILDASGSMLQRLGAERRIEIARRTLAKLATETLPAGTPFALRVFGRDAKSCATQVVLPLQPLNRTTTAKAIATLEAKDGARTAIAASLEQVASDLKAARGERVAIVITDGEETCAGDPAAAVRKLAQGTPRTVVHFVGFAVTEPKTVAAFRQWSTLGGGSYFDARDGVALERALAQAVQPGFEVVDATGKLVARGRAGGEAVRVLPGTYTIRFVGIVRKPQPVTVKPNETTTLAP